MIANNLKPFQPTNPGEVLKDELEYRGISQRGLAKQNEYDMLMAERNDSFMEKLRQIRRIAAIFWF